MEQENNKNEADNAAEDMAKSQSSENKSPNLLKAKSNIAKSMAKNFLKTRKATGTSEVQRKKQEKKNKSVSEGSKATENDAKKLNSREESQQKDTTTSMEHVENGQQIEKNKENTYASDSKEKSSKSNDSPKKLRRGEEPGRKNEEKQKVTKKRKRNEQKEKHSNSEKNNDNKEKHDDKGKKPENKKRERIDGLIFMCNAKTKPDCFRYHVMGVPTGKKDLVLGIRPGLKLFLYDYDLKLMYGIYKASSSGGMKLQPKAFGGAFPAQVRFSVHADCFPLTESIFKKAIKENYNENNKFKTELTARQVRKLTELFRPVAVHSTALVVHSPSRGMARILEHPENREAHVRPREARPPSDREASARDPYANISARSYSVLSHERDRQIVNGELASIRREDIHRDLYLSEKEYRAYGLQGERRSSTLQHHIAPRLGPYQGDYREQLLCQPEPVYRESVPMQRDIIRSDSRYLTEREYRTYDLGATREMQSAVSAATANTSLAAASSLDSYATDPYYGRYYGASLVDSYLPHPREAHLIETDHLRRRESNQVDRVYSTYASDALAYDNLMHRRQDVKPEAASTSVSSRYSFAGASWSYRRENAKDMGLCFSGDLKGGKQAIGGVQGWSTMNNNEGHNEAVDHFYRARGHCPLFTQIELSMSASNLRDCDITSKSDPIAVLYVKKRDGTIEELGRTEVILNSLNPAWIKKINVAYQFEIVQNLVFHVYDVDTKFHNIPVKVLKLNEQDFLGETTCVLSEIVTKRNRSLTLNLHSKNGPGGFKNFGTVTVHAEETFSSKIAVEMKLRCSQLDNKDMFSKSDPFLRISRLTENGHSVPICKTEVIDNNLNPIWRPLCLSMQQFGSKDNPLLIECFDFNSNGNHVFIGQLQKSVSELEKLHKDRSGANLVFPSNRGQEKVLKGQLFIDQFIEKEQFSFLDYVSSGFELNFMVAIDFTASNGNPHSRDSLHYIDPSGQLNSYQKAIMEVGEVMQFYDSDRRFPAWGFGGRTYDGTLSHCFNLNGMNGYEAEGVQGIMAAYASALHNVTLAGPTFFGNVINTAAKMAGQATSNNITKYFVLLIITDGVLTDIQETMDAVVRASDLPLSILIVGVGDADFKQMEILDADDGHQLESSTGRLATRDIVQFVPMREVHSGQISVVQALLEELPGQFLTYMRSRNIKPLQHA
ncbi:uncharacterized protein LOC111294662 [Durio zibethinus]|uniref:Uncharacterized protein LOC111294662 n=1 Tax=Durio zibethinus TaxID=66656 RepID=A0A6P5YTH8_DURZI|nr:uncharacterized protein LOC111294662 [Durio zibethinus]